MYKGFVIAIGCVVLAVSSQAQDTTRTINITSTYKPVLRDPAKVQFNAAPPVADSSRPVLNYSIPAENLFFSYQPADLTPSALTPDSASGWNYSNYIKAGVGNVYLPYIKAGMSFGDGTNTFFNLFASHFSARGDLDFQKSSQTAVQGILTYKTESGLEWTGGLGFKSDNYNLYGFRPDSLQFDKNDLRQNFQTLEGRLALRNIVPTEFGISYNPSLKVSYFSDNYKPGTAEANTVLDLPVSKMFNETVGIKLGVQADLTNYRLNEPTKTSYNNNLFLAKPSLLFRNENVNLHAGVIPSWDQGDFHLLPNLMADITTNDQRATLQVGWIGYYNKGAYQRFASINPWLRRPDSLMNTRVQEGYLGLKGSAGSHFTYSAKIGFQQHFNAPLFVNDTIDGKQFNIRYEPKLNIFQTHLEAAYQKGEQLLVKAGFNWNSFSKIQRESEAWGMLPMELNASFRLQVMKDLWFKTEAWAFNGARFLDKNNNDFKGQSGFDLNAGAEFRLTRNFNIWFQLNNILNNKYERWNQYQVYGFNLLGGLVYNFDN